MLYKTLKIEDPPYPKLLKEIPDPPYLLYIRGQLPNTSKAIAIVGTRKASDEGKELAHNIAFELAKENFVIVSGLALGIDTAAHQGTLRAKGKTISVLGNSIDDVYPSDNKPLATQIVESKGAVISEYGPGEKIEKENFLRRNRIVSGLSIATVVIEAPARSGSLATARLAGEQGRDVFVVPGNVNDENYKGSNSLIRDGALLVRSAKDVLEVVNNQNTLFDE